MLLIVKGTQTGKPTKKLSEPDAKIGQNDQSRTVSLPNTRFTIPKPAIDGILVAK